MIKRIVGLLFLTAIMSCSKDGTTPSVSFKEDPNNFFTATFNGKTLKTSGFIMTVNGVADDRSGSLASVNGLLLTQNIGNGVQTTGQFLASGSAINLGFVEPYKIPVQQLDVSFSIERSGNAVGSYQITGYNYPGSYTSSITDLTVGRKVYDIDPTSTTVTVTFADALYIQGTYVGKLIDGSNKISVTGTFKLRKI